MWKAIVYKELRENLWIGAAALAIYAIMVGSFIGVDLTAAFVSRSTNSAAQIPFSDDRFTGEFAILSALFAVVIGFRQTIMESVRGTWLVLFNRPIEFGRVVALKLLSGAAIFLVCSAVPILWYGCWAATPGTHASPFFWCMTWPSWVVWFSMIPIYLGAFLSGLRPGRWFGTRALPLAGATFFAFVIGVAHTWLWPLWLAELTLLAALLCGVILFVARTRDFS
ncbi:MAG TPA: hypothetical protein VGY55_02440 [Pirellulales bacterium]|jgi:hypothetical protein|nr:hypothetical protein [Pirellulales bacterium]